MAYPKTYIDLLERLNGRGCAVCRLLLRNEHEYLDSLLYEYVNDTGIQQAFQRGRGLCNHHSWLLTHHPGYSLGVSILFEAALDEVINLLELEDSTVQFSRLETTVSGWFDGKNTRLADKLESGTPCLACASLVRAEAQYIDTFADYWHDTAIQEAYQQSDGLCLPHFREVLRRISAPNERGQLVEIQRAKWESLKSELRQFQIKSAFNYVGEPIGTEADSWRRAVASLTGDEHALLTLTRPK